MKTENDLQLQLREQVYDGENSKSINTKSDEKKTYNVSCRKAVYCCLEYHVPIANICPRSFKRTGMFKGK